MRHATHTQDQIDAIVEENTRLRDELAALQAKTEREPGNRPPEQMGMVRSIVGLDEKIIQLDDHDQIEYINSAMAKMLGIDRQGVLGKHVSAIDSYAWGTGVLARQIEEARKSGGEREIEKVFEDPVKAAELTVIIKTTILQHKAQIIIQDITKQRQIETTFKRMVSPAVMQKVLELGKDIHTAERYEMTVLFGDLRGFSSTAEHAEPQFVRDMCNDFLSLMTEVIMKHQGTIDKYIGDEVMGLFGAPYYFEDHAIKALNAAIEMQVSHHELMQSWRSRGLPALPLGIGINSGEMVIGLVGSELRNEFTVLGHHVNLAARLCGLAGPGDIWLGSRTFELIREHVQNYGPNAGIKVNVKFKPAGKIQAKGIDEPVDIVNVLLKE